MIEILSVQTRGPGLYEITKDVARLCAGQGDGVLSLLIRHTSASLLIQENADPEVQTDLQNYFHRLVPPTTDPSMSYLTHTYEGPDDIARPHQGGHDADQPVDSGVGRADDVGDVAGNLCV